MDTNKSNSKSLIDHLTSLISEGNAHVTFDEAVEDLAFENLSIKPNDLPYSIWMLVEHIRITQANILDFSTNAEYKALKWPGEYWPLNETPTDKSSWQRSLDQIRQDRNTFISLLNKPGADLFTPFPHGDGQDLFREALLIADHTSYHTGQIILIRRSLNDWDS